MNINVEEFSYNILYDEIYRMLISYDSSSYNVEDIPKVFNVIDDDFYLVISKQFKSQMLAFAYMLSVAKGYMSLYLYSFAISSLTDCFKHSNSFMNCINSFDGSTQEEKHILIRSLDKIAQFYYDKSKMKKGGSKLLFYVLCQNSDLDIELIKRMLKFNERFNYKYTKLFLEDLLYFSKNITPTINFTEILDKWIKNEY